MTPSAEPCIELLTRPGSSGDTGAPVLSQVLQRAMTTQFDIAAAVKSRKTQTAAFNYAGVAASQRPESRGHRASSLCTQGF